MILTHNVPVVNDTIVVYVLSVPLSHSVISSLFIACGRIPKTLLPWPNGDYGLYTSLPITSIL